MKEIKLLIGEVKDRLAEIEKLMGEPEPIRIAIKVNDDREFKFLMQHYESLGWKWVTNENPYFKGILRRMKFPEVIRYCDKFSHQNADEWKSDDTTVIDFDFFCAQKGLTPPKFIMKSEDGMDLYEGDEYWSVWNEGSRWSINSIFYMNFNKCPVTDPDTTKAFVSKEAAEKWIEEQNKPKEIEIKLFGGKNLATITKESITIIDESSSEYPMDQDCIVIKPSDLEEMLHALKSL